MYYTYLPCHMCNSGMSVSNLKDLAGNMVHVSEGHP